MRNGFFINPSINNKIEKKKKIIKLWSKNSTIIPSYINQKFLVYNGKNFIKLQVNKNMVGHKLGEFVFTRARFVFKKKKKR